MACNEIAAKSKCTTDNLHTITDINSILIRIDSTAADIDDISSRVEDESRLSNFSSNRQSPSSDGENHFRATAKYYA